MLRFFPLVLAFCLVPFLASAQLDEIDGPYVMFKRNETIAQWAYPEDDRADELSLTGADTASLPSFPGFHPETFDPQREFNRQLQFTFSGVTRVAALSDIHGQYAVARKLLIANGIIDEEENWTFGDGHLVIVGDVFDRGDQVNATLWLIYHLQQQAPEFGGRVHFLLGNHETMVIEGDVRYVHKRYLNTIDLLKNPYEKLYGNDSFLGRWLRTLPLTVKINDVVYVHGGFSKEVVYQIGGLEKINNTYHKHLLTPRAEIVSMNSGRLDLLHGRQGPLWYRGYFLDRDFDQNDIARILRKLDAEHLVVGHTSFSAIKRYFGDRVFAVDSSIKFGSVGELLLIEDGVFKRGTLTGERLEIEIMKK
ncbi:metallophosphoesterase [Lewinella sp. 4G2]|uniref:metallophosphoesterase n=1 Tax=Lewinella sp. 4G2 TaxID=1803372 RepID=UPI0007E120B2|nr:metallophosphoesterase [Lewinella sp. 4G2]OAV45909.1 hypothetical protein A3850_012805 [Lewinella sp. 4G2]